MAAVEALPNKDLQLMYSLLRASYGPAVVPKHVADVLKVQKVSLVRNAFSDFVDGDRLSTALAFALADIIGPGSRELARTLNKDEAEGEKLSLIGREAVCYFLLALMRGRSKLREEFRKEVDRIFLNSIHALLNIYSRARQPLSLATLIMTGNAKLYDGLDEAAKEFAKELAELLRIEPHVEPEEVPEEQAPQEEQIQQESRKEEDRERLEMMKKLKRIRLAVMKADAVLKSSST